MVGNGLGDALSRYIRSLANDWVDVNEVPDFCHIVLSHVPCSLPVQAKSGRRDRQQHKEETQSLKAVQTRVIKLL